MKSILFAKNIQELFFQLKNNKELTVVGGCTELDELPEKSISVYGIPDLSRITRHERFLEIGPGATLAQILTIGQTHLPSVLHDAMIEEVSNRAVVSCETKLVSIMLANNEIGTIEPATY